MRRIALIIGIVGLGVLISFLLSNGREVSSIDNVAIGEVVSISGVVEQERKFGNGKLLIINEIPVFCECTLKYSGLNVNVKGIVERFPEDLRVRAFIVRVID